MNRKRTFQYRNKTKPYKSKPQSKHRNALQTLINYTELYGRIRRVNLKIWPYTSLDRVLGAAITSVSSSRNPKAIGSPNPLMVVVTCAATRFTERYFQAADKTPAGLKLDALTAEKVFGWQKVHKYQGSLVGRKQDKAGRWRRAKVPHYSTNPLHSYSVENRMKQLGRMDRYEKELSKITRSENIPSDWASPDQRCRAAIKAVGQYGQVIPLSRGRKQIQK